MSDCDSLKSFRGIIDDDLVEVPEYKQAGTRVVDFDGLLTDPIHLHEDLREGCGGQLWPAGMVLAKYLLRQPHFDTLLSKTIIELGAGGGVTGLGLARKLHRLPEAAHGTTRFILTDQAVLLNLMRRNIKSNDLPESIIDAAVLDWSDRDLQFAQPDVLLAADCVYFEPAFPLLLRTMKALIGPETVCFFCFKKRRRADLRFIKDAKKIFHIRDVEDDPDKPVWSRENLYL